MPDRKLRTLALFLVTGLLLSLLAACGSGEAEPAAPVATATPAPLPTATTAPPEAPAATEMTTTTAITASETVSDPAPAGESPAGTEATDPVTRVFSIDPNQSEARFQIDEVLRGTPTTVVGVTSLVSGDITINLATPAETTIGAITIDARSLATDQSMRNRAIGNFILQSTRTEYQFITFEPTSIEGLPAGVQPGDTFSFNVTGNLKIRDIVNPATFTVDVTADSDTQISGLARTTITRSAFELSIPSVPFVANVGEDVVLELQFVAVAQ